MPWEAAERRIAIPPDLQKALGLPVAVLRWSRTKHERVKIEHRRDIRQIEDLAIYLQSWRRAGPQPDKPNTWNVFFESEGRWFVVTIARDRSDSYNIVTVYGTTTHKYLERKWSDPRMVDREQ
jgi:hypothetical protein